MVLENYDDDEVQNLKNNENFLNNDLMEASISSSSSSSFSDDVLRKNVQEEIVSD